MRKLKTEHYLAVTVLLGTIIDQMMVNVDPSLRSVERFIIFGIIVGLFLKSVVNTVQQAQSVSEADSG